MQQWGSTNADGKPQRIPMLDRQLHGNLLTLTLIATIGASLIGCGEPSSVDVEESPFSYSIEVASPGWDTLVSEEFGMTIEPRKLAETVFQYKDFVVIAPPPEQLSFLSGERTVMVCCDPQPDPEAPQQRYYPLVLYAGRSATEAADEDELPLAFNHLQLHFIRRDRQWLMLSL